MNRQFENVYQDPRRADSYAKLELPGTYYMAFRDIPELLKQHVTGHAALDFGCGTGRSSRFLKALGYSVIGVDISQGMVARAAESDPDGDYRVMEDGDFSTLPAGTFDTVLCAFTFDNIPTHKQKVNLFAGLRDLLSDRGRIINLVSSPDIYTHEWASFTTRDFPENRDAKSGDRVKIIMTDVEDRRPVEDILWSDGSYREVYGEAGLTVLQHHAPLARDDEPYAWVNETRIAPWIIYVLAPQAD